MWAVDNRTQFADNHTWVRDRNGAEVWLVAVRGTFLIQPDGTTTIAEHQEEACLTPKYRGAPGQSSLLYDTDLPHIKQVTDILLNGHAHAPQGRAAPQIDVTLKVDQIEKTLRVFGDRIWEKGLWGMNLSPPQPFEKMPITYERAFGGTDLKSGDHRKHVWDERNPVGSGFAVAADHLEGMGAPNIEDPRALIRSWNDRPRPVGFGPIPGDWLPRRQWTGTYDEKWQQERLPLLPDDFNDRFYQSAPEDQQAPAYLRGGEAVELHNLTLGGILRFRLPRVALGFETEFSTGDRVSHRASLHSVILEPDVPRVLMVWHTHLPCHSNVLKLERTIISQKQVLREGHRS